MQSGRCIDWAIAAGFVSRRAAIHRRGIIRLTGYQVIRLSGYQAIRLSGYQAIRLSGYQAIRLSGYQVIRLSGYQAIRSSYSLTVNKLEMTVEKVLMFQTSEGLNVCSVPTLSDAECLLCTDSK